MNRNPEEEHHRFTRVLFPAVVILRANDCQWECAMIDISLKRTLLIRPAAWSAKSGQDVNIWCTGCRGRPHPRVRRVAHIEAGHVGVTCQHIDLDCTAHLRRLVELNFGDEACELQALSLPG